jgi:predicted transcriptional regulator
MQQKNKRCAYKKITEDIRRQIIGMFQAQESLKEISKVVGLNVSTCKGIIKVFQEEGRIGKKL